MFLKCILWSKIQAYATLNSVIQSINPLVVVFVPASVVSLKISYPENFGLANYDVFVPIFSGLHVAIVEMKYFVRFNCVDGMPEWSFYYLSLVVRLAMYE